MIGIHRPVSGICACKTWLLSNLWYKLHLIRQYIFDHSEAVGALPVGTAPTTSSFSTQHLASMYWVKTTARRDENIWVLGFGVPYARAFTIGFMPLSKQVHDNNFCKQMHISLKQRIFIMPTLPSLAALQVVIMTTDSATSHDKIGTNLGPWQLSFFCVLIW